MRKKKARCKATHPRRKPPCPKCGSHDVIPVVSGSSTPALKRELKLGKAILSTSEDWEGQPQWHCNGCGCEWRGRWVRFKKE